MAGTITAAESRQGSVKQIVFSWLSDASGDGTATATTYSYSGDLLKVVIVPGTSGETPDDLYDVTLSDDNDLDLLAGQGVDCPNAANLVVTGGMLPVTNSVISLTIAGGGNADTGKVYIWLR